MKKPVRLILAHLIVIVLSFVLNLSFMTLFNNTVIGSVLTTVLYIAIIYTSAWNEGRRDSVNAGQSRPNIKMAFISAGILTCIGILLLIIRVVTYKINPWQWGPFGDGYEIIRIRSTALIIWDAVYKGWNCFFIGFMNGGDFISYIIPLAFPFIVYPLGYVVGLTRKSISEKLLPKLLYKEKK